MRNRQTGVTGIGWLVLLTPFAIVGYAGIRLAPIYLNYMKVVKAMNQVATELKGNADAASIRNTLDRHFEIDMVEYPTTKEMKITREAGVWSVQSRYEDEAPLFGNISLRVVFDKTVKVGAGGPG
jgi:ribosomal protein L11